VSNVSNTIPNQERVVSLNPINATVVGKVSRILNLRMKWTARFKLRLLYPKHPFDERLGGQQSRYKFGSDNRTPGVQPAANCFISSVQLPRSEMSNGCSETNTGTMQTPEQPASSLIRTRQLPHRSQCTAKTYEPGNFLTEASALQKRNYVILYIPHWIQANELPS
jgi:hypothetical protein